jgi:hypothetical protein
MGCTHKIRAAIVFQNAAALFAVAPVSEKPGKLYLYIKIADDDPQLPQGIDCPVYSVTQTNGKQWLSMLIHGRIPIGLRRFERRWLFGG